MTTPMQLTIRLTDEDAARIGVPRQLDIDIEKLTARELITMERATKWSYDAIGHGLTPRPVTNAIGQPVWEMADDGVTRKKDPAGNPVQAMGFDLEPLLVVVWLAVRKAKGEDVPWDDFDIDIARAEFEAPEGKAQNRAERRAASKAASTTTRRRSGTTSTSRQTSNGS